MKTFPYILAVTLLSLTCIAVCAVMIINAPKSEEDTAKIAVGVVGDTSDTFLNLGIDLVKNIDDSRFYIDIRYMSKDEADTALENNSIIGYILIPDGFIDSIASMDNKAAVYYLPNKPTSLGTVLAREVIETVALYVTESQRAVAGLSDYIRDNNLKYGKSLDELSLFIATGSLLQRNKLYDIQYTGIAEQISSGGYYVAGFLLFFLLIWGLACSSLLIRNDLSMNKLLSSKGFGSIRQVIYEYAVYFLLTVLTFLLISLAAGFAFNGKSFGIRELDGIGIFTFVRIILKIVPVILSVTAMQFFMYEAARGTVASVLLQFLTAVILGYLSGCFYPNYFFPNGVRALVDVLPSGLGFSFMRDALVGSSNISVFYGLLIYTFLFLILSVLIRHCRTAGAAS